jgi:peptide deformylase
MILPIVAYGHTTLRRKTVEIGRDYPGLDTLIADMFETMYFSHGVGLAAPQVNLSIRLIVVDAEAYSEEFPEVKGFKKVFINPRITEESGKEWLFNEGCLSVPDVREDILRKSDIRIHYLDEHFKPFDERFSGVLARIIQHEYDHLEGVLFVDRVSTLRKAFLRKKLLDISHGNIEVKYRMIFPNKTGKKKKK